MKTIIAGSRGGVYFDDVCDAVEMCPWEITSVVSGRAPGADTFGEMIANHLGLPIDPYPIEDGDWERYGNAAGPVRNRKMAENAEALIAVWDGRSSGTKDMISTAQKLRLKIFIHRVGGNSLDMFE